MLESCRQPETHNFYHAQMLYVIGALLRTLAGFLASYYLYHDELNSARLNACIASDLRRPTYGNLAAFLRTCAHERIDWGKLDGVVRAVKLILKKKSGGLSGIHRGMGLMDALIRYRNSVVHGHRALNEEECSQRCPAIEGALCSVFKELTILGGSNIIVEGGPRLVIGDAEVPLFPLAFEDGLPMLGIMEGYDTGRRRIRYVCVQREWETEATWPVWVELLQRRGLSAREWGEIDEDWIRRRSAALLPLGYRLPSEFDPPHGLLENVLGCIDADGVLPAHDPNFAAAVLFRAAAERFCFILDPKDQTWEGNAFEGLTSLLGLSPSLSELPVQHPLNSLVGRVYVVVINVDDETIYTNWKNLERDFPGLCVLRVQKVGESQAGFQAPGELLPELFDGLADEGGHELRWAGLSAAARQWVDTFEKATFLVENEYLMRNVETDPVRVWREYLLEALPDDIQPSLADELAETCERSSRNKLGQARQLLNDLGVLKTAPDGSWTFNSEWARAATYGVALSSPSARQRARLADNPPTPLSLELCKELRRVCRATRYHPPLESRGGQALLALAALEKKPPSFVGPLSEGDLDSVVGSCALAVSWGRADAADFLLGRVWESLGERRLVADERTLSVASAVRRHGSPALAEKLFERLAGSGSSLSLRCKHELAGVLRDRGTGDDRARATRLYAELLAEPQLPLEQRVRSLSGAAENQMWLENFIEARGLLGEALRLTGAGTDSDRLRAIILHRLATVHLHEGTHEEGLAAIEEAMRLLKGPHRGAFAARCLDIYARLLTTVGDYKSAATHLDHSLNIKRALGDRLGLQKGLQQLSLLRQTMKAGDAAGPAFEALELAERSGDLLGQIFLHRRLAVLFRQDPDKKSYHQGRVLELSELVKKGQTDEDHATG